MIAAANDLNPQARTKCSVKGGEINGEPKINKEEKTNIKVINAR